VDPQLAFGSRYATAYNFKNLEVINIECGLGPVEADPEYLLIVEANNLAAEIDSETNTIHKFAR
jgi:hypothetical protein